jgi:hypothetical protein
VVKWGVGIVFFRDVCGREYHVRAVHKPHFTTFLTKFCEIVHDILHLGSHCSQPTRILEDFCEAFYVITSVLLVSLLYDSLKMITRVTETSRCNKPV